MEGWRSYDSAAEVYARVFAPRFAQPAADLVSVAEIAAGQKTLDIGTGTGVALRAAAATGAEAFGVDASPRMLAQAKEADPSSRVAAGDAARLPARDSSFETVTANFVIHLLQDPTVVLAEVRRVLKSGGRFACTVWSDVRDELSMAWREILLTAVDEELLDDVFSQGAPGRTRFSDRDGLEQLLLDAGFRQLWVEKREYRFVYDLDDYVDGLAATTAGRFLAEMLGPDFSAFMDRTRAAFRERFADPLNDFENVLLVVCRSG